MNQIDEALAIIAKYPDKARFKGAVAATILEAAENLLGLIFPAAYRRFVSLLGAGTFGRAEFYGITD